MKVLLIEDDQKITAFVTKGLKEAGFIVDHSLDGEEGLSLALSRSYDVVVCDVMLPKLDGFSLIEQLRKKNKSTPVLILSAKRTVDDRVKGLHLGSDDYLTKPFVFSELLARIHALIRRSQQHLAEPLLLTMGDLSIDLVKRQVLRAGKVIDLQTKEFNLLEYFMRNPGRPLSKTLILENIWNYNFDPQTNVVDVLVCRLRNKINDGFEKQLIETIRGVGYVLKD